MKDSLHIVVVGAGAVGGWVGGRLALAGHAVTLVGRKGLIDAVGAGGLRLRAPDEHKGPTESQVTDIQVVTSIAEAVTHGPFDLAVFSVKSYDTQNAISELQTVEGPISGPVDRSQAQGWGRPTFISFQNGVHSEPALIEAFGAERIVAGAEMNPISAPFAGTVVLEKRRGGLGLAPCTPGASVERWVRVFDQAVLPTRAYPDYQAMKWSKLLLNLIGNASSAILDMSTPEVYADPRLLRLEVAMLREGVAVMRGLGLRPVALPGYPVPLLAWSVRWAPRVALGPVLRKMVAGGRGEKPPSLLLDLRSGRQRSEIAELNGAIVRAGEQIGVPTPINRALTETLIRLVEGRIQRESIRRQPGVLLALAAEMKRKAA